MKFDFIGCFLGIVGALFMALNIASSGFAYIFWLGSSISWVAYGLHIDNKNILYMNFVFTAINLLGIYRWIIS